MENDVTQLCEDNMHERCTGESGACKCACHYRKAADYAHATLDRYAREGRTAKDFRQHAIAIHYSAMQFRMRRMVDLCQARMVSNAPMDGPMIVVPVGVAEIDDAQAMLWNVYERGFEDGKKKGIVVAEEREIAREDGLRRLRGLAKRAAQVVDGLKTPPVKRKLSTAQRKRMSQAQKRRWKKAKRA